MKPPRGRPQSNRKPPPPPKPKSKAKDPVEVYSRLRPLREGSEGLCAVPISNTVIQLTPPETALSRNAVIKETQYTFKFVFDEKTSQKALFDRVAFPLTEDLLRGKNGLLLTYGVTGSGKTFTMTGTPQDGGILPRSLDVIFNSLGDLQAKKFIFKPDRMNGFDVQSEADAMLDRQKELCTAPPPTPKLTKRKESSSDSEERIPDHSRMEKIDEDNSYSVFVQYVEIYNNYVYDLLEDVSLDPIKPRPPQSKILREDALHNMYIHGVTEVEVKCTDDAFEALYKGQKRRRVAHTTLNTESSRSHSVFTIRLVQAPLDLQGVEVLQEKGSICISQLSLVDLAGSERTVRTGNCGERLREAANINNSLMVLRTCIDILRENQTQGTNRIVPYRDSKLTHLFKNYFDGEGKVRMVVCINAGMEDYDENLHVMRFAEMIQEVQIARPVFVRPDLGLTPGRRRANVLYKEALDKLNEMKSIPSICDPSPQPVSASATRSFEKIAPPVCTPEFRFPNLELQMVSDEETMSNLVDFLYRVKDSRMKRRDNLKSAQMALRNRMLEMEKENILLKQQVDALKGQVEIRDHQLRATERKLATTTHKTDDLQKKLCRVDQTKRTLEQELDEKAMLLTQGAMEKERLKVKMHDKIASERERLKREITQKFREKEAAYQTKMWASDEKLRTLRDIVSDKWTPSSGGPSADATVVKSASTSGHNIKAPEPSTRRQRSASPQPHAGIAAANPRHRRSRSASGGIWIDHAPSGTVELGTILQPQLKKRKSVTQLTIKDITKDASKYVLTHQEADRQGDVETRLYKGNVIPSAGGGAQVIFNDVETLKQLSPGSRKRNVDGSQKSDNSDEWTDVETRCSRAIEGHTKNKKSRPK